MHLAETPEEQRKWMEQWRHAAVALRQVKREELRAMTDEDAKKASDILLQEVAGFYRAPKTLTSSGLVEQQRWFARARKKA